MKTLRQARLCLAGCLACAVLYIVMPANAGIDTGGGPAGGPTTWGTITGSLAAQADLQSALDAKQGLDTDLTAVAAIATTTYGRNLLSLADAAANRVTLQLNTPSGWLSTDRLLTIGHADATTDNVRLDLVDRSIVVFQPTTSAAGGDILLEAKGSGAAAMSSSSLGYQVSVNNSQVGIRNSAVDYTLSVPGLQFMSAATTAAQRALISAQQAFTSSSEFRAYISDPTGTAGSVVFSIDPTFGTQITTPKVVWWGTTIVDMIGAGSPEGSVAAPVGSIYRRTNGATNAAVYIKETGTGTTGWVGLGAPATGGGGTSVALDLGNDGSIDTAALTKIGTINDSTGIFSQTPANTFQINAAQPWPTASVALTGDSATAFFATGLLERARGGTGSDTSTMGNGVFGSDAANAFVNVNTIAKLETAIGGTNILTSGEVSSMSQLEALVGGANILTAAEINTAAGFDTALAVGGTPTSGNFLRGDWTWGTPTATAGGSDTQIQFNDAGALAGDATFTFNKSTKTMSMTNMIVTNLDITNFKILDNVDQSHGVTLVSNEDLTANVSLNLTLGNTTRSLSILGNTAISGTNTGDQTITLTGAVTGSGTGSFATTLAASQSVTNWTLTTPTISGAIAFPDGVRQTFNPNGTTPGLNVGAQAGDPSTPTNGDVWYDSTGNLLRARVNGSSVSLGAGVTDGDKGDVTVSGGGTVWTVDASYDTKAVSFQNKDLTDPNNTLPDTWQIACSDETTALTTGTAKVTFRAPYAASLVGLRASLTTASSSGTVTVDIKDSGATIMTTTKLTVASGSKTSVGGTAPVITDNSFSDDAEITIDITGAGTGATGLKVTFYVVH